MTENIKLPAAWLSEAQAAYRQYVSEWELEENERVAEYGGEIEPPQLWGEFFTEYLYAELENSVYVDVANRAMG